MFPYQYVILKRDKHIAWMVWNERSGKIVQSHAPALVFQFFQPRLATFLTAGFGEMERGELTYDKQLYLATM